jgi:hypothetical protein
MSSIHETDSFRSPFASVLFPLPYRTLTPSIDFNLDYDFSTVNIDPEPFNSYPLTLPRTDSLFFLHRRPWLAWITINTFEPDNADLSYDDRILCDSIGLEAVLRNVRHDKKGQSGEEYRQSKLGPKPACRRKEDEG